MMYFCSKLPSFSQSQYNLSKTPYIDLHILNSHYYTDTEDSESIGSNSRSQNHEKKLETEISAGKQGQIAFSGIPSGGKERYYSEV